MKYMYSARKLSNGVFTNNNQQLTSYALTIIAFLILPKLAVSGTFSRVQTQEENVGNGSDFLDDVHSLGLNSEFLVSQNTHKVPVKLSTSDAIQGGSKERSASEIQIPVVAQGSGLNVSNDETTNATEDGCERCDSKKISIKNALPTNVGHKVVKGKGDEIRGEEEKAEYQQQQEQQQRQDQQQKHQNRAPNRFQASQKKLKQNADNHDSIVTSDEKSGLFQAVEQGIFYWLTASIKQYFLCDSKCQKVEKAKYCSCASSCVALGTCCLNFMDMCSGVRKKHLDLKEILTNGEDVSSECINSWTVITSCPKQNFDSRNVSDGPAHNKDAIISQLSSINNETVLTYDDILQHKDNGKSMYMLAQMIYSNPIVDKESHLSYRNLSVLTCNHINLSMSISWETILSVPDGVILTPTEIRSIDTLFQIMNLTDMRNNFVRPHNYNDYIENWCIPDSVGTCPEGYEDEDIELFCKLSFLPVIIDNIEGSLTYKNPFCAVCNLGVDITFTLAPLFRSSPGIHNIILRLESWNITVKNRVFATHRPFWDELTCVIPSVERLLQARGKSFLFENVSITSRKRSLSDKQLRNLEHDKGPDPFSSWAEKIHKNNRTFGNMDTSLQGMERRTGMSTTLASTSSPPAMSLEQNTLTEDEPTCSVKTCLVLFDKATELCGHTLTITLVLPPLSKLLTDDDIHYLTQVFKTFFLDLIPLLRDQDRNVGERTEEVMHDRQYSYIFELTFFSEVEIKNFTSEERTRIIQLFQSGDFQFIDGLRYACARISMTSLALRGQVLCKPFLTLLLIPPGNDTLTRFSNDGVAAWRADRWTHVWALLLLLWSLLTGRTSLV